MARAGINKAVVQKARQSLLAKGINPSIDAVRTALGNTGSKTTISRYLKEIEARDPKPHSTSESLSKELSALVTSLVSRMQEEGTETLVQAQADFDEQRLTLEREAVARQAELDNLTQHQRRHETQLQQVHTELRQLQQTLVVKQDELGRLNRDNERLLSEARQHAKTIASQEDQIARQGSEIQALRLSEAKAIGAREQLNELVGALRQEITHQAEVIRKASEVEHHLAIAHQTIKVLHQQGALASTRGEGLEKEAPGRASEPSSPKAPRRPKKKATD